MGNEITRPTDKTVDRGQYGNFFKSKNKGLETTRTIEFFVDSSSPKEGFKIFEGPLFESLVKKLEDSNDGDRKIAIVSFHVMSYNNESPFQIEFKAIVPYRNALVQEEKCWVGSCTIKPNQMFIESSEDDGVALFSRELNKDKIYLFSGLEDNNDLMLFDDLCESDVQEGLTDDQGEWMKHSNDSLALVFFRRYKYNLRSWARTHKTHKKYVNDDSFEVYTLQPDRVDLPERLVRRVDYDIFRDYFNQKLLCYTNYIDLSRCASQTVVSIGKDVKKSTQKYKVTIYVKLKYVVVYKHEK